MNSVIHSKGIIKIDQYDGIAFTVHISEGPLSCDRSSMTWTWMTWMIWGTPIFWGTCIWSRDYLGGNYVEINSGSLIHGLQTFFFLVGDLFLGITMGFFPSMHWDLRPSGAWLSKPPISGTAIIPSIGIGYQSNGDKCWALRYLNNQTYQTYQTYIKLPSKRW